MRIKCCRRNVPFSELWVGSHEKPSDFYASSFMRDDSAWPLLLIRLLCFAVAVAILSWSLYEAGNRYWFLFLTNWGMVFVAVMLFSAVIVSLNAVANNIPDDAEELPLYISIYWFLYNVSISVALLITVLYWTLIYGPELKLMPRAFWLEVLMHGANSILVMVELLASRTPVKLLHMYQPIGVALWYVAFTVIYFFAGGTDGFGARYIYDILNWEHGARSVFVVFLAAVVEVLIYFCVYGVAAGRDKFFSKDSPNSIELRAKDSPDQNYISNV